MSEFTQHWKKTQERAYTTAVEKGFWEGNTHPAISFALIHSEVSEALEGLRQGNPPDDKVPEFSSVEAELADVVIRIMDSAEYYGWNVCDAIEAKMKFNDTRERMHGKKF